MASAFKTQSNCTGRSSDSNARRPYLQGHCRGSYARWSLRGLRLRGPHAARLGPGDGGNQNDAPGPYLQGQCRGSYTRWSPRGLRLLGQHAARLGPGDRGNQKDAPGPYLRVCAVAVTPDGRYVVSGSADHTLRVWDLATGETKTTLQGHTSSVSAWQSPPMVATWSPAPGTTRCAFGTWRRGKPKRRSRAIRAGSLPWQLHPMVATWSPAPRTTRCGFGTWRRGKPKRRSRAIPTAVAVTPDGRHVVSGSADHTLRVWDLATGETKTTLQGHTSWVTAVAVTPDGRHVVSGSADHTLRVWDLKDGKEILTFTGDGEVSACIAAQDNRTIVAGDDFGRLHFLRIVEADETKPSPGEVKIPLLSHSG